MKSVVWNDCIQFFVYMIGALAALAVLINQMPGGLEQIIQFGAERDKFHVLDFDLSLVKPKMTFWAGLIGGLFLTCATHGTDQMMVQRYLSARSQRSAGWAIALSGVVVMAQFAVFLLIGAALAAFYATYPLDQPFGDADNDRVFAYFIVHSLPVGLVGLTIAAVLAATMSTLSSSLSSSATAFINDIYLPLRKSELTTEKQFQYSRFATAAFGILQIVIALLSDEYGPSQSTVSKVLSVASFALGPMLGLYFLAVLARNVSQRAALIGLAAGIAILTLVANTTDLYWAWFAAVGSISTFCVGLIVSWIVTPKTQPS